MCVCVCRVVCAYTLTARSATDLRAIRSSDAYKVYQTFVSLIKMDIFLTLVGVLMLGMVPPNIYATSRLGHHSIPLSFFVELAYPRLSLFPVPSPRGQHHR